MIEQSGAAFVPLLLQLIIFPINLDRSSKPGDALVGLTLGVGAHGVIGLLADIVLDLAGVLLRRLLVDADGDEERVSVWCRSSILLAISMPLGVR